MTGIICVNKGKDITSFGVCAKVRGITKEKKCGHTGTLDPMATGVLPIMLGGATRFLDFLPESDKEYVATFILGKTTDTLDITGNVTGEFEVNVDTQDVINSLDLFRGKIKQLPPMYSAVSVNGQRLYDLARQGIEVQREEREIEIKELEFLGEENGEYKIRVLCTKGTYIRTLIDDIGKKLGCGGVMTSLVRTRAMGFSLDDTVTIEELQKRKDENIGFDDILVSVDKALEAFEKVKVTENQSVRFRNGGALSTNRLKKSLKEDTLYRVYSNTDEFLGLGTVTDDELKVKRVFVDR